MIPDMQKLYKPYSKDASLEQSLLYWEKEAQNLNIPDQIRDHVIAETFLEMANGKTFPIGTCDCGCDFPVEWSCVALNHYVLKKMIEVKKTMNQVVAETLQNKIIAQMVNIISTENQKYIEENLRKNRLIDWSRSPVLKWIGLQ